MTPTELLVRLLQVRSVNPPGDEGPVVDLVEAELAAAGLQTRVLTSPAGRRNLVASLEGPTDRPALVLLSHTDVVGVEDDKWTRDPFGGETHEGEIWGRGALDMKGIAVMHAHADMELARSEVAGRRRVIFVSVADEEAGGVEGARWVVDEHPEQVGFGDGAAPEVLGEGAFGLSGLLDSPLMPIVLGEKSALWLDLRAHGDPGHGSMPPRSQAALNLARVVNKVAGHGPPRVHPVMREQFAILSQHATGAAGKVFKLLASPAGPAAVTALAAPLRARGAIGNLVSDTAALTQMHAGYKHNVVPGEATASLDCRLLPDTDPANFAARVQRVASKHDVSVHEVSRNGGPVSGKGPLWSVLAEASRAVDPRCVPVPTISPGMTDVRYFRARGASGYGWVPMVLTRELLATIHGHDERVPVADFHRAVDVVTELVRRAAT